VPIAFPMQARAAATTSAGPTDFIKVCPLSICRRWPLMTNTREPDTAATLAIAEPSPSGSRQLTKTIRYWRAP
jgi:hypothetical protein